MSGLICSGGPGQCPVNNALDIQMRASAVGFDWKDIGGVLEKMQEELDELIAAVRSGDVNHAGDELGDLLFTAFSVARFLHKAPVSCLDEATGRFESRFQCVEALAQEEGRSLESCSAERLDAYWERAKKLVLQ